MLGTRTKQVFAYGRRGHRIVNVSEDSDRLKSTSTEPPPSPWRSTVSKLGSPAPRIVRKSKQSPVKLSPAGQARKRTRVRQIIDSSSPKSNAKRAPVSSADAIDLCAPTPARRPLSLFHPNVPNSPAPRPTPVPRKKPKPRVQGKGTPLRTPLAKPFSPFVDVDIIVLDDAGRRVSQERRVSRTDVQVNPVGAGQHKVDRIVLDDTEDEEAAPVKPPTKKRGGKQLKRIVISSDESGDERDDTMRLPLPLVAKPAAVERQPRKAFQVEVVLPALSRVRPKPLLPLPSSPQRPSSPPLPPPPALQHEHYIPLDIPSPKAKPRQLTPIRRGASRRSLFPRPPPSPSTPTDADLSLDFSSLSISPTSLFLPATQPILPPAHLLPLLDECGQDTPHEFSAFIETFPFDPIVRASASGEEHDVVFRKIGEASYSEVFGIGEVVLKVIPLRDESATAAGVGEEGPAPSDAKDVLKEVIVTRALGDMCAGGGFVKLLRGYVVRGRYPELLLGLWDEYDKRKGSEGVRPDTFTVSQTYAIIVLPNGGPDLEAYTFSAANKAGWRQACSLFWQVARALAQAEELVAFEHRDLHWGQILVKDVPTTTTTTGALSRRKSSRKDPVSTRARKVGMDDAVHGVKATVIDLGLARMDAGGEEGLHWTPFDEEIFEGEGDYQFDVYRMMKEWNGDEWEGFKPLTNVMWLHYLALKLLHAKRLRPPKPPSAKTARGATPAKAKAGAGFSERECYESLVEMEGVLGTSLAGISIGRKAVGRKGRRKTVVKEIKGPASAIAVVEYGKEREWVS